MDEKILDYMTKAEYASEHPGVVKNAEHADSATGSQFAENAIKLGGNESTYYASAASVTTLGETVNGVLGTANTAQTSANRAQETADMAKADASAAKNAADNAQATANEAKTNIVTTDAKAVAAQTAAAEAKAIAESAKEPAGCMKFFAGDVLPVGYLWCDGTSYSATGDYIKLYEAIGTKYNEANDPVGTFRVPDMRGRVGVGKDTGTFNTLGKAGGEERHILTVGEMPTHLHDKFTYWGSRVKYTVSFKTGTEAAGFTGDNNVSGNPSDEITGNTGGGQAHNNLQPYLVCNYIIKY